MRRSIRTAALVLAAGGSALTLSCSRGPEVHEQTAFVMGTVAELKLVAASEEAASAALTRAQDELARLELLTTPHSEFSDVSRLNAGGERVALSEETEAIFELAFAAEEASGGAFSPRLGAVLRAWGFPESPAVPESSAVVSALRKEEFDLGGVAKGYAVDRAAEILGEVGGCLVNVGGDIAVRGTRPDGERWLIGVQDPVEPERLLLKLRLPPGTAVATSGDYQRFVEEDGVRYHHILDPKTGWPARGLRSASVIARSCARADAWATAAFVLGSERGLQLLEEDPELEGVLVEEGEDGQLVLHRTGGFDSYLAEDEGAG